MLELLPLIDTWQPGLNLLTRISASASRGFLPAAFGVRPSLGKMLSTRAAAWHGIRIDYGCPIHLHAPEPVLIPWLGLPVISSGLSLRTALF